MLPINLSPVSLKFLRVFKEQCFTQSTIRNNSRLNFLTLLLSKHRDVFRGSKTVAKPFPLHIPESRLNLHLVQLFGLFTCYSPFFFSSLSCIAHSKRSHYLFLPLWYVPCTFVALEVPKELILKSRGLIFFLCFL